MKVCVYLGVFWMPGVPEKQYNERDESERCTDPRNIVVRVRHSAHAAVVTCARRDELHED